MGKQSNQNLILHDFWANVDHTLKSMTEERIRILHRKTGERLRLIDRVNQLQALSKLSVTDRVSFMHNDKRITGIIIRLNRRTATVLDDDRNRWNVSPSLLIKIAHKY